MTTPYDLTNVSDVKIWLGVTSTSDDPLLASLISGVSRGIYAYLSRPSLLPATRSEWYDGDSPHSLILRDWPVISVTGVTVDGNAVPQGSSPFATSRTPGYRIKPWDGRPPGGPGILTLEGYRFRRGSSNIGVTYSAGYQITNESALAATKLSVRAPFGPWASDLGVVYATTGLALASVSGAPTAGQYVAEGGGVYAFSPADAGASVQITYGFLPQSVVQACMELVAERYRYRDRIGQRSKSLGGQETVSFDIGRPGTGYTDAALGLLGPYRQVWS